MSKKWIRVLLVLAGILLFFSGWGLADFLAPKPALPHVETVLDGYQWFEEESSSDANRTYYFNKGNMRFTYSDVDGNNEEFVVPYTVLDNGHLSFDSKAVRTIQQSDYFYLYEDVDSIELALVHIDREEDESIYSVSIVWKAFNDSGDYLGSRIQNNWIQQLPD